MSKRYHWLHQSQYVSSLSSACTMCAKGSKMVVLITGKCPAHCYYCPLSKHKQHKDVIYADEWKLTDENDINTLISEAKAIQATGAGITGGDPLLVPKRTIRYIKLLKETFGISFHIHLYTSGIKNTEFIKQMVSSGLDEIRFHPEPRFWSTMDQSPYSQCIIETTKLPVETAIEIPSIPNKKKEIIDLIKWADHHKIDYINLNELEFSEQNEQVLYQKGYQMKDDVSAAAKISQKTAYDVLTYFEHQPVTIGIHYCSSSFKDGVQLTNRMKRRAHTIATDQDIITEQGTLLKGIIESTNKISLKDIITFFKKQHITAKEYQINTEKNRIQIHPRLAEKLAETKSSKKLSIFIIEEYPTADHLEVERIPLP